MKKYLKFIIIFIVLNFGLFLYNAKVDEIAHEKFTLIVALGFIILELAFLALYFFLKEKKKWKIENIFLSIFLPLGFLHIFITPMNQLPDEIVHIFRVYNIADGNIVAKKNEEGEYRQRISKTAWQVLNNAQGDSNYYKKLKNNFFAETSDEKWGWSFANAATYNTVDYTPQVAAVSTGQFLGLPAVMTLYLGRIFTLLAFTAILYFAIKLAPKFKEFFIFGALLPMSVQQGMAYSADWLVISASFLLTALALKYTYGDDKKLSKWQIAGLYIVTILLGVSKSLAYLPFGLLLVLIPAKKFGKKPWVKYLHLALIVALTFGLVKIWGAVQDKTVVTAAAEIATDAVSTAPTPTPSIIDFLIITFGMLFGCNPNHFVNGLSGANISYGSFTAPVLIYNYIMLAMLVIMVVRSSEKIVLKKFQKLLVWAIPIICLLGFYYVAAYSWKFVDETTINGIQGRYLISFIPLIPLLAYYKKKSDEPLNIDYVFMFGIFINACLLSTKFVFNF